MADGYAAIIGRDSDPVVLDLKCDECVITVSVVTFPTIPIYIISNCDLAVYRILVKKRGSSDGGLLLDICWTMTDRIRLADTKKSKKRSA